MRGRNQGFGLGLAQALGLDVQRDLEAEADLSDLGLDSLRTIDLLVQLEGAFGILVPDDLLTPETFRTPGSLWGALDPLRSD